MFGGCKKSENLDVSGFNTCGGAEDMGAMFKDCETESLDGVVSIQAVRIWAMFES